jgi:tRNA (guanine37-N1)-methyltransferase
VNFHVVTLFPETLELAARGFGVVGQAIARGEIGLKTVNPREFTSNVHHTIDDRPFGGGDGMIMMAEPLAQAIAKIRPSLGERPRVIHVSPRGARLDDKKARELASFTDLVIVTSRYGGADQRFLNMHVDEEISIGDYILTGGELPALVLIDAVGRLQPGVLGNEASSSNESFAGQNGLLEHPQYTRPREWNGQGVPAVYLSGDHAKITLFQEALSVALTALRRPDLFSAPSIAPPIAPKRLAKIRALLEGMSDEEFALCGLSDRSLILARLRALETR